MDELTSGTAPRGTGRSWGNTGVPSGKSERNAYGTRREVGDDAQRRQRGPTVTYQALVDEVLGKVDQPQGDDEPHQALLPEDEEGTAG